MRNPMLLVIDFQNDFVLPQGTLTVPGAFGLIEPMRELVVAAQENNSPVYATLDWHDRKNTEHFGNLEDGKWPVHCVKKGWGARISGGIFVEYKFYKGQGNTHGYSGQEAVAPTGVRLFDVLAITRSRAIIVCGVATEFCVKSTVLDLLLNEFMVYVVSDLVAAVNKKAGQIAIGEMILAGARIINKKTAFEMISE